MWQYLKKGLMRAFIERVKQADWVLIALVALGLRSLYEASLGQAMVVACFSGLVAWSRYLSTKQVRDLDKETREELDKMKNNLSALAMKNTIKAPLEPGQRFF
jgi:hypothetical protein